MYFRRLALVKGHVHTDEHIQYISYTKSRTDSSKWGWMGLNGDKLHGGSSCSCSSSLTPPRFRSTSSCLNHTEAWTALSCHWGGSPYTKSHNPPPTPPFLVIWFALFSPQSKMGSFSLLQQSTGLYQRCYMVLTQKQLAHSFPFNHFHKSEVFSAGWPDRNGVEAFPF